MNGMVTALMSDALDEAKLQFRLRLFTTIAFVLTLLASGTFASLYMDFHVLSRQKEAGLLAAHESLSIKERLNRSLSSTYALAAVLRQGDGRIPDFETLGGEMIRLYGGIGSLQLARAGVVSQVVPFVGNAQEIGRDLLKDTRTAQRLREAMEARSLSLFGPVETAQGEIAVIGRLPVFLPMPDSDEHFWGFATAVIRVTDMLAAAGLPELEHSGYRYELAHQPPESALHRVFARSGDAPLRQPIEHAIDVPNGKWILRVAPEEGWLEPWLPYAGASAALLLSVLAALLTYFTFRQPLLLRREVAARTQELAESNRNLNAEIAERNRAQDHAAQSNRLLGLLSHTNAAIARIPQRQPLLDEICRIAVDTGGFPLAAIALRTPGGNWQWMSGRACRAEPESADLLAACNAADGAALDALTTTLQDGAPVQRGQDAFCQRAQSAGFGAQVFLPLRVGGELAGVFSLYARAADCDGSRFGAAQLRLLKEMAGDLSFALENIERETRRKEAEAELRKLSRAVEQSANAVVITNRAGIIEYVNPCFTRITGYSAAEVLGKTPSLLKSDDTHPETYRRLWSTILSGKEWTGELHNRKKNGESYWCMEVISPLKDEHGEITHFVAITEDISERKQAEQKMRHLAFHDPLTDLPNRRLFNDRLHQAAAMRHRKGDGFALLLLDIDRFNAVNDTLGHDVGDALLRLVAARLEHCVRKGDTLARIGGDEFALITLEVRHPEDMARLAEKLLDLLKQPFQIYGHELYVTASIGVTLFPDDTLDADALIKNADIALYRAKELGRNRFQFFTDDMNAAIMQRLRLENAMRGAVERGEFLLHYQPQVHVASGTIRGAEALIRWRHPELGMVSPAHFIPVAEETGMIVQIGEWTLRTACAQASTWREAGTPLRVAVNLSARQFHHGDLARLIADLLDEYALPPQLLEVELTEGILMEDTAHTGAILDRLHEMGVQISIDDFGTGYSSLSYLKRLPIQVLKIDQSFVRDIDTDPDDRAIVTAVIALAHSLKLEVVAEGVETAEQLAFLREYGCDLVQGYLFSRPVPGEEVGGMLQAGRRLEV